MVIYNNCLLSKIVQTCDKYCLRYLPEVEEVMFKARFNFLKNKCEKLLLLYRMFKSFSEIT